MKGIGLFCDLCASLRLTIFVLISGMQRTVEAECARFAAPLPEVPLPFFMCGALGSAAGSLSVQCNALIA